MTRIAVRQQWQGSPVKLAPGLDPERFFSLLNRLPAEALYLRRAQGQF